jgi:hypothetical protein
MEALRPSETLVPRTQHYVRAMLFTSMQAENALLSDRDKQPKRDKPNSGRLLSEDLDNFVFKAGCGDFSGRQNNT